MSLHFNIKSKLFRTFLYVGAMAHVRHWRGHGVHSPFVYSIIRNVFMKHHFVWCERALYNQLRQYKIGKHAALQLQNLHSYCKYNSFALLDNKQQSTTAQFRLLMPSLGAEATLAQIEGAPQGGYIVAIMLPRHNRARVKMCRSVCGAANCLSIDNRRYILLFHDPKLPRQHFKL